MAVSHNLKFLSDSIKAELIGKDNLNIFGLCSLDEQKPAHLAFYKGTSFAALKSHFNAQGASAFIVNSNFEIDESSKDLSFLKVPDPHKAFIDLIPLFYQSDLPSFGIHKSAVISETAKIQPGVNIGPFSVIGANSQIGSNSIIHPHVTIYPNVIIGENCTIHSGAHIREGVILGNNVIVQNGAILGADGFGYISDPVKGIIAVPQVGNVIIGDHVEIGANTCIDRGALDPTRVGKFTKIDNLVQIGHNTQIGSYTIICGQSAIAGSSKIGNQVVLGGNVGIADHAEIADGCRFAAFSGVKGKFLEKGDYAGNPALPAALYRRVVVSWSKLPTLISKLRDR